LEVHVLNLEFYRRLRMNPKTGRCLSQDDVAEAIGIGSRRVAEFEKGLAPSPANLLALARFFGIPEEQADLLMQPIDVPALPGLEQARGPKVAP
jgi:transcriptional regulator with XRE-family HTH domain